MLTHGHMSTVSSDALQMFCPFDCKQKLIGSARRSTETIARKSKEKITFWGIEVVEALTWQRWSLGREFTKHLTLRNVCLKTQKLRFRPPTTRFFVTIFPQPIILSPGMSLTLPIIFRPLEKKEYEDRILFEKQEGEFSVALHAKLPRIDLHFPESIQLPLCAVYDSTTASFILSNVGDIMTSFNWEIPSPFTFFPSRGLLDPGEECKVKVVFQPKLALVHNVFATCSFGDTQEQKKNIRLLAIAKYPHLLVYVPKDSTEDSGAKKFRDVLSFGSVAVGTTVEKFIEIYNLTVVNAPFKIERVKEPFLSEQVFFCDVTQAVVPASGKSVIPLRFSPQTVGVECVDYFTIMPVGNVTHSVLKVTGTGKGPNVSFEHTYVFFGCVNLGESLMLALNMTNNSEVPAYYLFDIDCQQSVFNIDHPYGFLAGNSTTTLMVIFRPTHPIVCHRRVVCLVHHQGIGNSPVKCLSVVGTTDWSLWLGSCKYCPVVWELPKDPIFLDFIGTCHSNTVNPYILKMKDLTRYRIHMARGLTFYPPDILGTMLKEGKLLVDEDGTLTLPPELLENKSLESPFIEPMIEYFHDGISSDFTVFPPHVSLSIREFDFGCCAKLDNVEPLPLSLTNHTNGKITVIWTNKPTSPFQVTPESCDISPLKSMAFRVTFQPSQLNSLYAAELEGFAFYKVMRHYSNIEELITLCAPWSLTIHLRGHTFEPGRQHFIPQYSLDCSTVFPPVCKNTNTYQSMMLCNIGNTAISFNISREKCPSVLVKPHCGFIPPKAHQLILLSTCPVETSVQQHSLLLHFNFSPSFSQEITLQSSAEPLVLLLEGDGYLYFKPTGLGFSSSRTYTIKNCTRLPMLFKWKIQHSDKKFLSVRPDEGSILPNEALAQTWTFSPGEQTKYLLRSWVTVWREQEIQDDNTPKSVRYILRVIAEGVLGTITAKEEHVDVGNVLVGSTKSCELELFNNGLCTLKYVLSVQQMTTGPCDPEEAATDQLAIELDHYKGTVAARGRVYFHATIRPARQVHYKWTIKYAVSTFKDSPGEKKPICCVTATGIYPSVCIADVCGTGSVSGISKLYLWKLFSLETLNQYLERDPTPEELTFRVPTRHSTLRIPPVYTPVMVDFNFGAAPVGSEPSIVVLMLKNNGVIPVNWAFLFPCDQKIEMEYWAEVNEFDPTELHQMRILDNKLFSVTPKTGYLLPGQEQIISLYHRHDFIGTDRLPVLLKISYGREILLNFIGVTLDLERRYIHFTSKNHMFTPIAIGTCEPPKQIYELYNGGSTSVTYEIQIDALTKIQEDNYQHAVFVCLNPRGEIGPGLTAQTEWIFSPLEAKTYSLDVPIHILEGDSALITFQGIGYDPYIMGETAHFDEMATATTAPVSAKLTVPGLPVYLSQPRIAFGNIPVYSKCSRLFFLNNASENEAVVFSWHIGTSNAVAILTIVPDSGVVQPGESIRCILTLFSGETPCFYSVDLVCEIYMQQSLEQYEKEQQEWEAEKERQSVEFTITEKDLDPKKKRTQDKHPKWISDILGTGPSQVPTNIQKYKTLPPIRNIPVPRPPASRSERRQLTPKDIGRIWARPEPPRPFLMHMGVTARSHSIDDFVSSFSDDMPKHFLYHQLKSTRKEAEENKSVIGSKIKLKQTSRKSLKWESLAICSEQEAQLVTDILCIVIKGLLEESQFHAAMIKSLSEPIPYFRQFWCEESAKLQDKKQIPGGTSVKTSFLELSINDRLEEDFVEEKVLSTRISGDEQRISVIIRKEQSREQKEALLRMPAFANLTETVLDNTIQNILVEASRGEVVLTSRPKIIALPRTISHKVSPVMSVHRSSLFQPPNVFAENKDYDGQWNTVLPH